MLELEDALAQILAALPSPQAERLALSEASGRVLAEDIVAPLDLPGFDNSAMDGYAVRAADVTLAAASNPPVPLRLVGRIAAGESFAGEVAPGTCVRLFTGSPLPRGADAVVMQEDTRLDANAPNTVLVLEGVKPRENVRLRGEDVRRGTVLVQAGERLTPAQVSLLAAVGIVSVQVGRSPTIGLLATGSELREAGTPLGPGQLYESNRPGLACLIRCAAADPRLFPLVPDTAPATQAALQRAFQECDAVITSGGVSVGELDFVKNALLALGGELAFWRVAIKPGRPFVLGRCGGKLLFGLPGNPVSAMVTFLLLVRPALLRWQGARAIGLPLQWGELAEPLNNSGARRHFVRVRLDAEGRIFSAGMQGSHVLSSLARAHGLVDLPPGSALPAGARVQVMRFA